MGASVARIYAEIKLKDSLSGPLKTGEKNLKKFADVGGKAFHDFGIKSKINMKEFANGLDQVSDKVRNFGLTLTAALTVPIIAGGKSALDAAAKMESMRASMTAITRSARTAGDQLKYLEGMSKRTATSYEAITRASTGLISGFRGDVIGSNKVLENFATLSNVLSVSSADFDRIVTNMIQISGSSSLAGDELRQMSELLPPLREMLERAFGTSQTEKLAKMGITGRQALEGLSAEIQRLGYKSDTNKLNAKLQELETEFFKLKVAAGEALLPMAKVMVDKLLPALESVAEKIRSMTPAQKEMAVNFLLAAAAAGPMILALAGVGKAISGLISFKIAFQGFAKIVESGLLTLAGNSGALIGMSRGATLASGAMAGLRAALVALTGPVGIAIAIATALFIAWQKNLFGIQDMVKPMVKRVSGWFKDLGDNIGQTTADMTNAFKVGWQEVYPAIKPAVEAISKLIQGELARMVLGIEQFFRAATDIFNTGLGLLQMLSGRGFGQLSDSIKASMNRIAKFVLDAMVAVVEALLKPFKFMQSLPGGLTRLYDPMIAKAEAWVTAMKVQSVVADTMAKSFQNAADKARALKDAQEAARLKKGVDNSNKPKPVIDMPKIPAIAASMTTKATELTKELVRAMGRAVDSPGSQAAAACAYFASSVIAKFTKGVTDEGGKIQWSAGELVRIFREKLGAGIVNAADAMPGALAFRKGSGPSGFHVGINAGDGAVMDMNGQRDRKRNKFDLIGAEQVKKEGWQFMNIPDKFLDPKFDASKITEAFQQQFEAAERAAAKYAERLGEIHSLERDLLVEQMKASGARMQDIISVQEFGKSYDLLTDAMNRAKVDAMVSLDTFKQQTAEQEEARAATRALADAKVALNRQVSDMITGMQEEIALSKVTTEAERVKYAVTIGGLRTANPLLRAALLLQAQLLDQSNSARRFADNWAKAWGKVIEAIDDTKKKNLASSQDKYDEYLKTLTKRMMELKGAEEELFRAELTEQFQGFSAGAKTWAEGLALVAQKVQEIIDKSKVVTEAEKRVAIIKGIAANMETVFMDSLDNMFENGFKNFFDDVIGGFRAMVLDMAKEMLRLQIQRAILWGVNQIGGAGTATMGSLFGSGKASGGMVFAGTSYPVGERGPEMFTPGVSGKITPSHKLGGGGVTNIVVNVTSPTPSAWRPSEAQAVAMAFARANRANRRNGRG